MPGLLKASSPPLTSFDAVGRSHRLGGSGGDDLAGLHEGDDGYTGKRFAYIIDGHPVFHYPENIPPARAGRGTWSYSGGPTNVSA
jgi:hypothetical protein